MAVRTAIVSAQGTRLSPLKELEKDALGRIGGVVGIAQNGKRNAAHPPRELIDDAAARARAPGERLAHQLGDVGAALLGVHE
jgi:hypothetical protein